MKRIICCTLLLLFSLFLFSQKISNVDFDYIKKTMDASPGLYKELLNRFVTGDSTLTKEQYSILYYGQCFNDDYNPYGSDSENFDKFKKFYLDEKYDKALPLALKMITKSPLDMKMTFKALVCYHKLENQDGIKVMKARYNNIMNTIFESGDGKSPSTAMVVMRVSDEYEMMANMRVENTSQALVGSCDLMELKENDLGLEKLYFNVSKLFEAMFKH
jgi:Domain of unknown function (DUF4919)